MQLFEYPFKSNYATVDGVRLHYLDEGQGPVIWLMHGNTSWSYLYRKMIPLLVEAGYRCFVPDLMGFGFSDNPRDESVYSLRKHVELMSKLIQQLDLHDIITGPLPPGFTFLFKGGAYSSFLIKYLDVFRKFVWLKWKTGNPSKLLGSGFRRPVNPLAMENYLKIHDKPAKRAGLATFPKMIPNRADHPEAGYIDQIRRELEQWDVPVLVMWADGDMAWKPDEGARIAQLMGESPADYKSGRLTYDLRRLRLHGVIIKIPGTHRYQVTDQGMRICLFLTKVHNRIIRPGFSQLMDGCPNAPNRPVANAMRQLDGSMEQLIDKAKLAA